MTWIKLFLKILLFPIMAIPSFILSTICFAFEEDFSFEDQKKFVWDWL
jgi:hypothetical protein